MPIRKVYSIFLRQLDKSYLVSKISSTRLAYLNIMVIDLVDVDAEEGEINTRSKDFLNTFKFCVLLPLI